MGRLLYLPKRRRIPKDDLGPARGTVVATIAGLSVWASIFAAAHWIFS
jgi:hypothetical protein